MHIERLDRFGNIFSYYGLKVNIIRKEKLEMLPKKLENSGKLCINSRPLCFVRYAHGYS